MVGSASAACCAAGPTRPEVAELLAAVGRVEDGTAVGAAEATVARVVGAAATED